MKPNTIKSLAIALALASAALAPVGTAGVTGSMETVPVSVVALAALPINSTNDILVVTALNRAVQDKILADISLAQSIPSAN